MSAQPKEFTNIMEKIKQVPTKIKEAPPKKFGKVGAALVLGGIGFGWVAFPYILSFAISQMVHLSEGSDIRNVWKAIPYLFDFNIYIFNVTNPVEVQNGAKPILQEVGPYRYKEFKEKVDLVDDIDEGTITYSNMNTWYFQKEKTLPLTGEERVTIPHLPLWSMLLVAESDFPSPLLSVVNAAVPKIYGKLKSVFMTATVNELLFKGVLIDCSAKDFLPKIICVAVKQNSKPLVKLGNNRYLFSVLGARNGTPEDARITVKSGYGDAYSIGKVVRVNGKSENTVWRGGECNRFAGTDATIFPPYRRKDNNSIIAYATDVCRSIYGVYDGEGEYKGIQGNKYYFTLGDSRNNPKEACYCPKENFCLKKGAIDLTKCQGAPLVGTLPHFYDSDEDYLNGVIGLKPERDKHALTFLMEPISATPLIARKRFQFNLPIHPIRYVNVTKKIVPTLLPFMWLEECLDLEGELMDFLEANLLSNLRLANGFKWTLIVLGAGLCFFGVYKHQSNKRRERPTIRVTPSVSGSVQTNLSSRENLIPSSNSGASLSPFQSEVILEPSLLRQHSPGDVKKSSGDVDPQQVSKLAGVLYERITTTPKSEILPKSVKVLQQPPTAISAPPRRLVMTPIPGQMPPIETPQLKQRKTPPQPSAVEESKVYKVRSTGDPRLVQSKPESPTSPEHKETV